MINMKKTLRRLFCSALGIATLLTIAACGNTINTNIPSSMPTEPVSASEETTPQTSDNNDTSVEQSNVNILIAYFTAAENSDVDVISSASVVAVNGEAKGCVRTVADMIQSETRGDLFSIQTSVEYAGNRGELIDFAAEEQDAGARPELTAHIDNLDAYDTIFIGYPNWWADLPMVMYSFFEEYDFSGKTIIPFNVHNGSRFSSTIETIQELEPNATVITDGLTVSERDVTEATGDVADWLKSLGY